MHTKSWYFFEIIFYAIVIFFFNLLFPFIVCHHFHVVIIFLHSGAICFCSYCMAFPKFTKLVQLNLNSHRSGVSIY